jgi:outer membrane protein
MNSRYYPIIFSIVLSIFSLSLLAEPLENNHKDLSLRMGVGYSDVHNLGDILMLDFQPYKGNTYVANLDGGWRFVENMQGLPLDWYLKGGLSCFDEKNLQEDFFEATLYVKVYYKWDLGEERIRIGFGEGLSWASAIPIVEIVDAQDSKNDNVAKLLNYLDISADFDLGRLTGVGDLNDLYLGFTIKHRSGVFGLFSGVHGGSNYKMLTIEKNF